MSVWYAFLNALGIRMFEMDFMKNALPEKTTKIYRNPTRIPVFLLLVCRKKV